MMTHALRRAFSFVRVFFAPVTRDVRRADQTRHFPIRQQYGRQITGQKARPPRFPMERGVIRKDQWPWQDRRTLNSFAHDLIRKPVPAFRDHAWNLSLSPSCSWPAVFQPMKDASHVQ
jgi:hypothetical protein